LRSSLQPVDAHQLPWVVGHELSQGGQLAAHSRTRGLEGSEVSLVEGEEKPALSSLRVLQHRPDGLDLMQNLERVLHLRGRPGAVRRQASRGEDHGDDRQECQHEPRHRFHR
jgi:hypothetical protein